MNNFETIETEDLHNVNGGNRGQAVRKAGSWLWRNVVAPAGGGAIYNWAADRLGGGQQQQPTQPPAQQPPAQPPAKQ
ncbi:MAG: hypothetical protein M4D80_32370 [Myxococcota bacterium]|nr:hypothetical protein [Myxococcota bacterium]